MFMKFTETFLAGAYLIDIEPLPDARGFFARTVCEDEFARHGLNARFVQASMSFNHRKRTLRGMHYQAKPHEEIKLVRCTGGAIYDVIVDLRPDSATYRKWLGAELSRENRRSIYIPRGFAHGFVTLEDHTEVLYEMTERFHPESARGLRWSDPAFAIEWPAIGELIISERDRHYPDYPT
jgi:dTDP-4-dehydrorhamnose 3,5-epimerase